MLYSAFITTLRTELHDLGNKSNLRDGDVFSGDASRKVFELKHANIKDSSYTVNIAGSPQTETTHFTIDKDTGIVTFVSAPGAGTGNVEVLYTYVRVRDDEWIEFINDAIDYFQWTFWTIATDLTTLTTTAKDYDYDTSGITGLLYILKVWYKETATSDIWIPVNKVTNWRFYQSLDELHFDPYFSKSDLPIKILYLQAITKAAATTGTIGIPTEWLLPIKLFCKARFYEMLVAEKIHETGVITTQPSYSPAQLAYDMAQRYQDNADEVAKKIAPKLPPQAIRDSKQGVNM